MITLLPFNRLRHGPFRIRSMSVDARNSPQSPRCSVSLMCIVHTYQWLGISFGGFGHQGKTALSCATIVWSITCFCIGLTLVSLNNTGVLFNTSSSSSSNTSTPASDNRPAYYEVLGDQEVLRAKPILELLINSVVHLFALDNLIAMVHLSFVSGHRVASHLSTLSRNNSLDSTRSLAVVLMSCIALVSLVTNSLVHLFNECGLLGADSRGLELTNLLKLVTRRVTLIGMNIATQALTVIFVYGSVMYSRHLNHLRSHYCQDKDKLDLSKLLQVKHQLTQLSTHYDRTIRLLRLPLLFSLVSSTCILVGSICMLLILPGTSAASTSKCRRGFIVYLITRSLTRLTVVIYFGQRVSSQANELIEAVRNRVQLSSDSNQTQQPITNHNTNSTIVWLVSRRLKHLANEGFECRLLYGSAVVIKQSLVIAVLNFVITYTVLLIQTDYGPTSGDSHQDGLTHNKTTF